MWDSLSALVFRIQIEVYVGKHQNSFYDILNQRSSRDLPNQNFFKIFLDLYVFTTIMRELFL